MADVVLKNIKKVYPNIEPKKKKKGEPEKEKKNNLLVTEEGVLAVHDFNLEIKDNEFIVLVGPSGCHPAHDRRAGGDLRRRAVY